MPSIPDLPGLPVPRQSAQEHELQRSVAQLCELQNERFPGSQPISLGSRDLKKLETKDYWVFEKTDGIRVLLYIQADRESGTQDVYLIDRHNTFRTLFGFFFPHYVRPDNPLGDTIIDGELVLDTHLATRQVTLRFLAFDCLACDGVNVMSRNLEKRYGRLREQFYKPFERMMHDHPHMMQSQAFEIRVKKAELSYAVEKVFSEKLEHDSDGLIYTCVETPYVPGTDMNTFKWKEDNSLDFRLILRFPADATSPDQPDFYAKPIFLLYAWFGGSNYEVYDKLTVDDDEWLRMKKSKEQIDDRIVEVHWSPREEVWRMMRFRDDKPHGNHISVVENTISSISDVVDKETLIAGVSVIRNAWRTRHNLPIDPIPPPARPMVAQLARKLPLSRNVPPRYGPMLPSKCSKVGGPVIVAGMHR